MATKDEMVRNVRYIGESLIKNAESIVGSERFVSKIEITAEVRTSPEVLPIINTRKEFFPERFVEEFDK